MITNELISQNKTPINVMEANKTIKENDEGDENVYNTSQAQIEAVLRSQQHFYANDEGDENVYNTSQAQVEAVLRSQQHFYANDEKDENVYNKDQVKAVLSAQQHLNVTLNRKDQRLENSISSEIKENVNSCYEEVMPDLPTYSPTDKSRSTDILTTPFKRPRSNLLVAALILIILATGITISVVVLIMKWPSNDKTGRITHIFHFPQVLRFVKFGKISFHITVSKYKKRKIKSILRIIHLMIIFPAVGNIFDNA